MNRKSIFVLLLLPLHFLWSTLIMRVIKNKHKKATEFKHCIIDVPKLHVKLSPDPLKPGKDNTFTVSGKLDLPLDKSDNLTISLIDPKTTSILDSLETPIC